MGSPISDQQIQALIKNDSILHVIQLNAVDVQTVSPELPPEVSHLLQQFASLFEEPKGIPPSRPGDHQIPLLHGAQPFRLRPYHYNPAQKDDIEKQISDMLKKGLIQYSSSPFSSPILLVKKKTGDWRLCVDFRRLNALTVKNKYPLPIIDEILDELFVACWFSS